METPTADEIKQARKTARLTQKQAAEKIHVNLITWQRYELGTREMHPAFFELFKIKTGIED